MDTRKKMKKSKTDSTAIIDDSIEKFTKYEILISPWYSHNRDVLEVALDGDKKYSLATIEKIIKNT